jgi:diguanylate cyclase (GGDEF)-like protein
MPILSRVQSLLEQQSKVSLAGLAIALIFLISTLDYCAPPKLSFSLFYLMPISLAAWFISQRGGHMMAIASAIAWLKVDLSIEAGTYTHPSVPYWNMVMRLGLFLIISTLIAAQKQAYQREQEFARMDSLTGIYNRRHFLDILEYEANRARRYHYPLTLAYLDVDNFKAVNDKWGHVEGDRLLVLISSTLQQTLRKTDVAARLGGDEFAMLLPQTDEENARIVLPRVHQQLLQLNDIETWNVGFSIGSVTFTVVSESVDSLISQADHLMYSVKQNGKNQLAYQLVSNSSGF